MDSLYREAADALRGANEALAGLQRAILRAKQLLSTGGLSGATELAGRAALLPAEAAVAAWPHDAVATVERWLRDRARMGLAPAVAIAAAVAAMVAAVAGAWTVTVALQAWIRKAELELVERGFPVPPGQKVGQVDASLEMDWSVPVTVALLGGLAVWYATQGRRR